MTYFSVVLKEKNILGVSSLSQIRSSQSSKLPMNEESIFGEEILVSQDSYMHFPVFLMRQCPM
jgi:hypothetical protein